MKMHKLIESIDFQTLEILCELKYVFKDQIIHFGDISPGKRR